jgi:hypothetical protein
MAWRAKPADDPRRLVEEAERELAAIRQMLASGRSQAAVRAALRVMQVPPVQTAPDQPEPEHSSLAARLSLLTAS